MTNEGPIWTDEELSRLLGARDGYIHALAAVRLKIGHIAYYPIDKRHVRKIAEREAILKPLRELDARLQDDLNGCKAAYDKQYQRAHPRVARTIGIRET